MRLAHAHHFTAVETMLRKRPNAVPLNSQPSCYTTTVVDSFSCASCDNSTRKTLHLLIIHSISFLSINAMIFLVLSSLPPSGFVQTGYRNFFLPLGQFVQCKAQSDTASTALVTARVKTVNGRNDSTPRTKNVRCIFDTAYGLITDGATAKDIEIASYCRICLLSSS